MNWLDRLERKIGRHAIPNMTKFLLIALLAGYAMSFVNGEMMYRLFLFSPSLILKGQVWRLVSWLLIPTGGLGIFGILFMICLLSLGNSLENGLGTFKMNVYYFGGILLTIIGGFVIYFITHIEIMVTSYYILFALYLMLGLFMPEAEVRLYFVLPIKMKWLMILYVVGMVYEIYSYFSVGVAVGIMMGSEMIFAMINLFFFVYTCKHHVSRKQRKRQREFRSQFAKPRPGSGITQHKCCICGRTELDDPTLSFRYCSKCAGSREYCQDHLFTHSHVRGM